MASAKALIFASRLYEGLPMTIIEAYKSSLPVISCNIGNADNLVEENITGVQFKSNDVPSVITTINTYEKTNILTLKKNAKDYFIEKYTDSIGYKNIMNIYSNIINFIKS